MPDETDAHKSPYHHGNLKQALVDAYIDLMATTSADKLSLRRLAAEVGVAPTAVYNHFADKEALVCEVRTACLNHFADYLEEHYRECETPRDAFALIGKTYYRYSMIYPDYFTTVFQCPTPENRVTPELITAGMRAESRLRQVVIDLYASHGIEANHDNEALGAFACWSLAHGITTLSGLHVNRAACNDGRWPEEFMLDNEENVSAVFDSISHVLVEGLLAHIGQKNKSLAKRQQ